MVNDDVVNVLERAWPDGLPAEEQAHWAAVPDARRDTVLRRLGALVALDERGVPVGEAAAMAGLSRQAFHKLRRRWAADRSIRSVTPYRAKASERPAGIDQLGARSEPAREAVIEKILELIRKHPGETNGRIARLLLEDADTGVSLPTTVKMVRNVRNAAARQPEVLESTFGASLLVDFVGIRIAGVRVELDEVVIGALVLERGSGLILGFDAGEPWRMSELQTRAIDHALRTLTRLKVDVERAEPANCRIVLPPPAQAGELELAELDRRLSDVLGRERVSASGLHRFGVRTTSIIGHRLGRVLLYSRLMDDDGVFRIRRDSNERRPALSVERFVDLAKTEISRRNEPLLAIVRELSGRLVFASSGAMTSTLRSVSDVLTA